MPFPQLSEPPPAPSRLLDNATFNTRMAAMMTFIEGWPDELNAFAASLQQLAIAAYSATSASAVEIGEGTKLFAASAGAAFIGGHGVLISDGADPGRYMKGEVESYDPQTGALDVTVAETGGAGTFANWKIALTLKDGAPIDSPALLGIPTAPTAAPATNTAQLATTAYVFAEILALADAITIGTAQGPSFDPVEVRAALGVFLAATAAEYRSAAADRALTAAAVWAAAVPVQLADAATIAVDLGTMINGKVTLGGNRTLGAPVNGKPGQTFMIEVYQDAVGARGLAYHTAYKFDGGTVPTLPTAPNARSVLHGEVYSDGTIGLFVAKEMKR